MLRALAGAQGGLMSANQWLRLWHDMPNDPKWRSIARASGQRIGDVIAVYVHLLVSASTNATERGRTHSFSAEDVANALDIETSSVEEIVRAMQSRVMDGDKLAGWEKRQPAREDGSAERARAWREKNRLEKEAGLGDGADAKNAGTTRANAPERNRTQDTEKIKSKRNTPLTPRRGATYPPDFEAFWSAYPNRAGKETALKAWAKIAPDAALQATILAAVEAQKRGREWQRDDGRYIPHGATWLNGSRWEDEVAPAVVHAFPHNRVAM